MGINMERVKFTTSLSGNDVRWYKRTVKSDRPFVLYVNGKLTSEATYMYDANREYEKLAAL